RDRRIGSPGRLALQRASRSARTLQLSSREVGDEAADCQRDGMRDGNARDDGRQRVGEIVHGRRRPLEPEIDEAIVDPAMVDEALPGEDRGFRRDRGAGQLCELLLRIAQRVGRVAERLRVDANRVRRVGGIWIHEEESDALRRERATHALHYGRVAMGDRTVGGGGEKDGRLGAAHRLERIDRAVVEVENRQRREGEDNEPVHPENDNTKKKRAGPYGPAPANQRPVAYQLITAATRSSRPWRMLPGNM